MGSLKPPSKWVYMELEIGKKGGYTKGVLENNI
jgi:hypothetical protein